MTCNPGPRCGAASWQCHLVNHVCTPSIRCFNIDFHEIQALFVLLPARQPLLPAVGVWHPGIHPAAALLPGGGHNLREQYRKQAFHLSGQYYYSTRMAQACAPCCLVQLAHLHYCRRLALKEPSIIRLLHSTHLHIYFIQHAGRHRLLHRGACAPGALLLCVLVHHVPHASGTVLCLRRSSLTAAAKLQHHCSRS